jgi:glycosyltransferase involved in cell wall biosynthesis
VNEKATTPSILLVLGAVVRTGISGGDELVTNLAAAWRAAGREVLLLTTKEGRDHALAVGFPADGIQTVRSFRHRGIPVTVTYALRAFTLWRAAARITRAHRGHMSVFATSFFLPDMAAVAGALLAQAEQWVLSWQLVIPPPWIRYDDANAPRTRGRLPRYGQSLSYLSQQSALALFRRRGTLLVVPSRQMADEATLRRVPPDRVAIVRYGIDSAAVATAGGGTRDGFSVVFLGRFHAQKGLDDLPRIWLRVRERRPDATLGIIGGGNDVIERRLRAELAQLDVTFLGVTTGEEKYRLLSRAKVLAFPSHYESWGHVVLEGMACRLAVVGYEIPSSLEAFGDAILYRPLGDADGFGDAIADLLEDDDLRRRYVAKGAAIVANHEWRPIADDLLERIALV